MNQLRDKITTLYAIGIPYAAIAKRAGVDKSLISKFANGKTNIGQATRERLNNIVDEIRDQMRQV